MFTVVLSADEGESGPQVAFQGSRSSQRRTALLSAFGGLCLGSAYRPNDIDFQLFVESKIVKKQNQRRKQDSLLISGGENEMATEVQILKMASMRRPSTDHRSGHGRRRAIEAQKDQRNQISACRFVRGILAGFSKA